MNQEILRRDHEKLSVNILDQVVAEVEFPYGKDSNKNHGLMIPKRVSHKSLDSRKYFIVHEGLTGGQQCLRESE